MHAQTSETTWKTKADIFKTSEEVEVKKLCLPQFTTKRKQTPSSIYSIKIAKTCIALYWAEIFQTGRDRCSKFEKKTFEWDGIKVKMVTRNYWGGRNIQKFWVIKKLNNSPKEELNIQEPLLDANYVKPVLVREVKKINSPKQ